MNEQHIQHHVDMVAMQLFETAGTITSLYTAIEFEKTGEFPDLRDAIKFSEWVWQFSVADTMKVIQEDSGREPTDMDEMRSMFMLASRRQFLHTAELVMNDKKETDKDDPSHGLYL